MESVDHHDQVVGHGTSQKETGQHDGIVEGQKSYAPLFFFRAVWSDPGWGTLLNITQTIKNTQSTKGGLPHCLAPEPGQNLIGESHTACSMYGVLHGYFSTNTGRSGGVADWIRSACPHSLEWGGAIARCCTRLTSDRSMISSIQLIGRLVNHIITLDKQHTDIEIHADLAWLVHRDSTMWGPIADSDRQLGKRGPCH